MRAHSGRPTQKTVTAAGKALASTNKTELVIHLPDGEIRDSDSNGNDPYPPKVTKP